MKSNAKREDLLTRLRVAKVTFQEYDEKYMWTGANGRSAVHNYCISHAGNYRADDLQEVYKPYREIQSAIEMEKQQLARRLFGDDIEHLPKIIKACEYFLEHACLH